MRGKGYDLNTILQMNGITPAYAGKSFEQCGKKLCRVGSPPPMRGKVAILSPSTDYRGITPAYAGKSSR